MADANPTIPDEFRLFIREQLARTDKFLADAEKARQEIAAGPKLLRLEIWQVVIAGLAAVGIVCGALGYKIGATPQHITIHLDQPLIVHTAPKP